MDWFCNYCIICTNLSLEPQYVILLALLVILIVYFKSRLGDRNILLSSILFALISGFVLSVSYVFQNVFKQHHRDRFNILLGKTVDLKRIGYNTNLKLLSDPEDGSEEGFSRGNSN
jgi:rod shape determining protein RodA